MLSGNEIREIVMDSDSDEDKYYDSATEDEEPSPPSDSIPLHSLQVRIIPPAALKMRSMLAM